MISAQTLERDTEISTGSRPGLDTQNTINSADVIHMFDAFSKITGHEKILKDLFEKQVDACHKTFQLKDLINIRSLRLNSQITAIVIGWSRATPRLDSRPGSSFLLA